MLFYVLEALRWIAAVMLFAFLGCAVAFAIWAVAAVAASLAFVYGVW